MREIRFWLRWSGRDLRARWLVVAAIALLIAAGTGVYAGLKSLLPWQVGSYDANFAALRTHNLEIALAPGTYVTRGTLARIARSIPSAGALAAVEERVIVSTEVDVRAGGRSVLVPGRLVGVPPGKRSVDVVATRRGRALRSGDRARPVAQLEYSFATHWRLPERGLVRLAGGRVLRYVGFAQAPEDLVVVSDDGLVDAGESFAIVYAPLATAAAVSGHRGQVNDLVLRVRSPRMRAAVRSEIERALATRPALGATTVSGRSSLTAVRVLYADARGEQRMYNVFALLLLGGAAFAAFNLVARVVEAQRREIGIGLALGAPSRTLAIRPLLMAAEVSLLGVALGVAVGLALDAVLRGVIAGLAPLPSYRTPFEVGLFAQAAAIGFALPFAASVYPVVAGVRRTPIDAIAVGARAARGAGLAPLLRSLPLPGRSLAQLPARNLLRRPARAAMTALSLGVVVTILLAILGILDSVAATSNAGERALVANTPTLTLATLDRLYPADASRVRDVAALPAVGGLTPSLRLAGTLGHGQRRIPAVVSVVDPRSRVWRPATRSGTPLEATTTGILIAAKAAQDLGVSPGDTIAFSYLRPGAAGRPVRARVRIRVAGIGENPLRAFAYLSAARSRSLGYGSLVNTLTVSAADGTSQSTLERALFAAPGVASVEPAAAIPDVSRDRLRDFVGIVHVVEAILLGLALLIAFNATSISAEERLRDHATMFAFGLPVRSAVAVAAAESAALGVVGTAIGIVPGWLLLRWILREYLERTYPGLGLVVSVSAVSAVVILVIGVVAVGLAPLLTARGLRRMDVPARLRTIE